MGYEGQDVGWEVQITRAETETNPGSDARNFDPYSQVAEISHFNELQKSCDSQLEHRSYVTRRSAFTTIRPARSRSGTTPLTITNADAGPQRQQQPAERISRVRVWVLMAWRLNAWQLGRPTCSVTSPGC